MRCRDEILYFIYLDLIETKRMMFKPAFLFVVFALSIANCMKSKPLLLVKITEIEYEYEVENDIYKDCGNYLYCGNYRFFLCLTKELCSRFGNWQNK